MGGNLLTMFLLVSVAMAMVPGSLQLQASQTWSLLKIQQLLNYPAVLSHWHNYTDFCYGADYKTTSAFVECYGDSVTQLHIIGDGSSSSPSAKKPLPKSFSIDSFFTTLTRLPDLRVLTLAGVGLWGPLPGGKLSRLTSLEIVNISGNYLYGELPVAMSRLGNLQTFIADGNLFSGEFPDWLGKLPELAVLSLRNNSMMGTLPESVAEIPSLRSLVLAGNNFSGNLPDLSGARNLQVIDLANNSFGPEFPRLGRKVASVVLAGNRFSDGLPPELAGMYLLERLDVSGNRFVGPFMPALLSLPSIEYLSVAGNRFTGFLSGNISCGDNLRFVDISSNLLTGTLPNCLSAVKTTNSDSDSSSSKTVLYAANCLAGVGVETQQHPAPFCKNQAIAVGIVPDQAARGRRGGSGARSGLVAGVVAAAIGAAVLAGVVVFVGVRKASMRRAQARPPRRLVEHASSAYPSKLFADARYISQTVKLGALGIPAYRSFSLVELEAATNDFEVSNLMGQDSHGQMYRGRLSNGTPVTIRSLKVKRSQTSQNFNRHIEMISKLRHRHLVSALGHCFEYNLDDSTVTQLYLVFEYVQNGNLRGRISQGTEGRKLTWVQRISTVIGVAKGIQFLHGGIIPGLFANNLKITNILLDQNVVAKIGSYNIPILSETMKSEGGSGNKYPSDSVPNGDKIDIFDFGVILLEVVSGRPITSIYEVEIMKEQLQSALTAEGPSKRRSFVDPAVSKGCSDESVRTVMEICLRCLAKEAVQRPSVEDVLWNLQFAAQVQDDWRGDSRSSEESPLSPSQIPRESDQ
uniref:Protein kinase domain-containing protein n=1 Tax=Leersia perrieri TaxID=77586 RepID=A0A0D9WVX3_9ORYZ